MRQATRLLYALPLSLAHRLTQLHYVVHCLVHSIPLSLDPGIVPGTLKSLPLAKGIIAINSWLCTFIACRAWRSAGDVWGALARRFAPMVRQQSSWILVVLLHARLPPQQPQLRLLQV